MKKLIVLFTTLILASFLYSANLGKEMGSDTEYSTQRKGIELNRSREVLFSDDFETLTGWTLTGEFEIDAPAGLGGDPSAAFGGTNVLGSDLTGLGATPGEYENGIPALGDAAESPVIDCTDQVDVKISFQRWLGVESSSWDHAYIHVWDGSAWIEVYMNPASTLIDPDYELYTYDVTEWAAGNADFKVRFSIGATDGSVNYCGWNIDNFVVFTPSAPEATTLVAPEDGGLGINPVGNLEWNMAAQATGYKVFFGTDNPPSDIVNGDEQAELTYAYTLDTDVEYFWQIVPTNDIGDAVDCPIWSFTTLDNQWLNVTVDDATLVVSVPAETTASDYVHLTNNGATEATYIATLNAVSTRRMDTPSSNIDISKSESNGSALSTSKKEIAQGTRDLFDIQFTYDVTTASGGIESQAGVECDGEFIYTSVWNSGDFLKFDMDGNYIETFQVPGCVGTRDLAYDGEYFYGADASTKIWVMDFATQTLIETINYSGAGTRAIAYDDDMDGFWVNNWDSDMLLIDRAGDTMGSISGMGSIYGAAYDNYSEGGPYLWVNFGTGAGGEEFATLKQYDIESASLTGVEYLYGGTTAGGMFISEGFVDGTVTIAGLAQGEAVYGFELAAASHEATIVNPVGTIAAGETVDIEIFFDATAYPAEREDIDFNYDITYTDAAGIEAPSSTALTLTITGVNNIDGIIPTTTTLNQNYPNPFNPVTSINFYNNLEGAVKLTVYNVKGELVNTLVDTKINKGFQTVKFDAAGLNSGVYYYKLATPEKTLTKKMVLVK